MITGIVESSFRPQWRTDSIGKSSLRGGTIAFPDFSGEQSFIRESPATKIASAHEKLASQ